MIIKYKNEGGVAELDKFIGMDSCCHDMMMSIMNNQQIKITSRAYLHLMPSEWMIQFCPYCGKQVERINI